MPALWGAGRCGGGSTVTKAIALRDNTEVAERHSQVAEVQRLGGLLAASGYFADAREMAQAAVKVMAGEELGIPPVAAMMGINIIKGKIALGGNLIASRIRAHGFDFIHRRFDNAVCVLTFLGRKGDPDIGKGMVGQRPIIGDSAFTMEDAKTAQVTGNEHYKKNPRNMLFNRAISNGAKWFCPEVFAGAPVYVPEELGAKVDEQGDMVHDEPAPAPIGKPTSAQRKVAERKIHEMEQGKPYADVSTPEPPPPPEPSYVATDEDLPPEVGGTGKPAPTLAGNMKAWLGQFAEAKGVVGEAQYYSILSTHGYAHANEIPTRSAAIAVWRALDAEIRRQQEATE